MATQSLLLQPSETNHYTIKEFQLLVKDAPVVPAEIQPFVGVQFRRSGDIYRLFKGLAEMPVETFLVLHLDGKKRMVGMTTSSIGTMTSSLVHPRDVFRTAIANMTAGLVFIHNHPSGDPSPSKEDVGVTRRLCKVGKVVGIRCLDHIIIGQGRYFSFADHNLMG